MQHLYTVTTRPVDSAEVEETFENVTGTDNLFALIESIVADPYGADEYEIKIAMDSLRNMVRNIDTWAVGQSHEIRVRCNAANHHEVWIVRTVRED